MRYPTLNPTSSKTRNSLLLLAAVVASGLLFAGCDEHVDVVRDRSVAIPKGATWAWRPTPPPEKEKNPVISRDVMPDDGRQQQSAGREDRDDNRIDNETLRLSIRTNIEETLTGKGFKQVGDPAAADFLVDYHVGIRRRTVTVERGYPGGYPGFVCGPFGCWASYRWGYWGGPGWGYENIHYREGTIVFDFVQQGSNKIAFRAVGQKQLNRGSFSTDHVRDAVRRLLRDLKPGK
jgi:Domain of unknown function (DUF4136)